MKGQEFDVFKLLISAMIAIAILMILQQILGQFQNLGTSLKDQIIQQLKTCGYSCGGQSKEITINADKGTKICYSTDLKDQISADSVHFDVSDAFSDFLTTDDDKDIDNGCLEVTDTIKDKKALLKVCCNNGDCKVAICKPNEDCDIDCGE